MGATLFVFFIAIQTMVARAENEGYGGGTNANLVVSPSSIIMVGSPMNLTCTFQSGSVPGQFRFMASLYGSSEPLSITITSDILANGLVTMLSERVNISLVNAGSILFSYNYTELIDSGVYLCMDTQGNATSNMLTIHVVPPLVTAGPSAVAYTMVQCNSVDCLQPRLLDVSFVVAITVTLAFCLVLAISSLVIGLKYRKRFTNLFRFRRLRTPDYHGENDMQAVVQRTDAHSSVHDFDQLTFQPANKYESTNITTPYLNYNRLSNEGYANVDVSATSSSAVQGMAYYVAGEQNLPDALF